MLHVGFIVIRNQFNLLEMNLICRTPGDAKCNFFSYVYIININYMTITIIN